MNKIKLVPIGIDNFKEIVESYYYIDKTNMIEELLKSGSKATLITRPRRFGKTLNMSMLKYFFEDARDFKGNKIDNSHLFNSLYISSSEYMSEQGKYPVINLSFKECKKDTWKEAFTQLKEVIQDEYERHEYILESENIRPRDRKFFEKILDDELEDNVYDKSIVKLCMLLENYHQIPTIVLLDEYDVILQNAYVKGFYKEACNFISTFFGKTFKQNDYMKFAVITGCLRISKESIFTGWNMRHDKTKLSDCPRQAFNFVECS